MIMFFMLFRYQSSTAKICLDTILDIQPKDSSGGGGETRETIVKRQAGEMLEKLPADYLPHEVRAKLQKMGALAPMNIFLRQEIDRMQRVIGLVRSTLQDLQLAIDGTIVMSEVRLYTYIIFSYVHPSTFFRVFDKLWTPCLMRKFHPCGKRSVCRVVSVRLS